MESESESQIEGAGTVAFHTVYACAAASRYDSGLHGILGSPRLDEIRQISGARVTVAIISENFPDESDRVLHVSGALHSVSRCGETPYVLMLSCFECFM
jgi:hypothetical protein